MQNEIVTILQDEDMDIREFYQSLSTSQKEHSESVAGLTVRLVKWIAIEGLIQTEPKELDRLYQAVLYHDIGLTLIPDRVLCKTEELTGAEFRVVQRHASYGATLIERYRKNQCQPGSEEDSFWMLAAEIALSHHERWDGKGYPYKQSTTGINSYARAVSIADAYDSIVRGAPFRMALPPEYALLEIMQNAGRQFDPQFSEIFRKNVIKNFHNQIKGGGTSYE